jgi:hypothetical protein
VAVYRRLPDAILSGLLALSAATLLSMKTFEQCGARAQFDEEMARVMSIAQAAADLSIF